MPTILSHPAVPLAIGLGLSSDVLPKRLLLAGVVGSILPDVDILAFPFGIPYEDAFGHRGFSHSFFAAALVALLGVCACGMLRTNFIKAFAFLLVSTASHGVLDAFTNGGLGIAFLWPWSANRYFAPFRPIRVSPIGISDFFQSGGVHVLLSELLWIWLPCALAYAALTAYRGRLALSEGLKSESLGRNRKPKP
jgi:inner membrane protein